MLSVRAVNSRKVQERNSLALLRYETGEKSDSRGRKEPNARPNPAKSNAANKRNENHWKYNPKCACTNKETDQYVGLTMRGPLETKDRQIWWVCRHKSIRKEKRDVPDTIRACKQVFFLKCKNHAPSVSWIYLANPPSQLLHPGNSPRF